MTQQNGAVFFGAIDGKFKFTGQVCKLGVQGGPLTQ